MGDGATPYSDLPYIQAVAADVWDWAKNVNLIDGVLATYTLDESMTGKISASDTLKDALNKIENAIASAIEGSGEENQNAFTHVKAGDTTIAADSKTDTLEIAAGSNVEITADADADKLTISANHPPVTIKGNDRQEDYFVYGDAFTVVDQVVRDEHGHVTEVKQKVMHTPDAPTTTHVRVTHDPSELWVDDTIGLAGDIVLGDAAKHFVGTNISTNPTDAEKAQLPTTEAVKAYADGLLAANDAMVFKGTLGTGGSVTSLPAKHEVGWTYRVATAGTYAGHACEVGDLIVCITKGASANDAHWTVAQTNIDGAVTAGAALANGSIIVGDGAKGVKTLPSGTSGQVLKVGNTGLEWGQATDTKVSNLTSDAGKVVTGLTGNTTLAVTDVGNLKLNGYAKNAGATGALAATDTISAALNKLSNAIDGKTNNTGTVTSVGIQAGNGISVTGSPVTSSGTISVGINNTVAARTSGLYSIAHNAQGLITASAPVTSISTDLLTNGADTIVFYGGTSTEVW